MDNFMMLCGTPLLAVLSIVGLFIFIGLLVDPEGIFDWFSDIKNFWLGDDAG